MDGWDIVCHREYKVMLAAEKKMDLIGFYDIKEIKPDSQRLDRMFCLIWRNYI